MSRRQARRAEVEAVLVEIRRAGPDGIRARDLGPLASERLGYTQRYIPTRTTKIYVEVLASAGLVRLYGAHRALACPPLPDVAEDLVLDAVAERAGQIKSQRIPRPTAAATLDPEETSR